MRRGYSVIRLGGRDILAVPSGEPAIRDAALLFLPSATARGRAPERLHQDPTK